MTSCPPPPFQRPSPRGTALLACLVLTWACGRAEPTIVVADLVEEAAFADVFAEPGEVDVGESGGAALLGRGWSDPESDADGTTFVWSDAATAVLSFHLGSARDLDLQMRARAHVPEGQETLAVHPVFNGVSLAPLAVSGTWSTLSLPLPASAVVADGGNRLVLDLPDSVSPARQGTGTDRRRLGIALDRLRVGRRAGAGPPATDDALILSAGGGLDFHLDLPADATLVLDQLAFDVATTRGARVTPGEPVLTVAVTPDRGTPWRTRVEASGRRRTLALGATGPTRISLRVLLAAGTDPVTARLGGPRIVAPRPAGPPDSGAPRTPGLPALRSVDATTRPPDLLLYLVDTLRADRVGSTRDGRPLTPAMDRLAAEATVHVNAWAQSSWTKTSVASLFTGLWPPEHGVHEPEDALPLDVELLAERLRSLGYRTVGIVTNAHLSPASGFDRGFDHYEYLPESPNTAADVRERFIEWLDRQPADDPERPPWFVYLHTIDPHAPYDPAEDLRQRFAPGVDAGLGSVESIRSLVGPDGGASPRQRAGMAQLYDAEVAEVDAGVEGIVSLLEERGLWQGSLFVFLSDHGEAFWEHGVTGHGWDLSPEVMRMPLLVKWPFQTAAARSTVAVQHTDVHATLLRAASGEVPPARSGGPHRVLAHMDYEGRAGAALLLDGHRLVLPLSRSFGRTVRLHDLERDPLERQDLSSLRPVLAGYLRTELLRELARAPAREAPRIEIDSQTRERLRALGYLGGG